MMTLLPSEMGFVSWRTNTVFCKWNAKIFGTNWLSVSNSKDEEWKFGEL